MNTTWAGIVRVSHMGARRAEAADFHAEKDQITAMHEAVEKVGGTLDLMPSELDVSGGLPLERRPSLLAAVEGVENGTYAGIAVAYHSRLGREVEQEEAVWRRVEQAGGQIIMALDGLDTSTVDGKMVRRIRSAINTGERERHAERFDNLRKWATENGIWQRRQTPRGYNRDSATRRLVPNAQADELRWAFRARAAGASISTIAQRLEMTTSGVRQLLKSNVYLGVLKVGPYVNPKAHEPLMDRETWEAAQVSTPRPPRSTADGPAFPALLAGLVRCASCGHVMSRKRTKSVVYACPGRHSGERCPAPASITTALVDALVERIAVAELARLSVTASEGRGVERAQAKLADGERERDAFLSGVKAAGLSVETFAAAARERQEAVEVARDELNAELGRRAVVPNVGTGAAAWKLLDGHQRNRLLRSLLAAVVVARAGGRGARMPVEDRVRVLAFGADVQLPERRGGEASGIVPIPLPDLDDPRVLRLPVVEDRP